MQAALDPYLQFGGTNESSSSSSSNSIVFSVCTVLRYHISKYKYSVTTIDF